MCPGNSFPSTATLWCRRDFCEHSQFSLGALVHRFFIEPGYLQVGDSGTVSGLRLGARQRSFKKTSQSRWPVKEHTQCGLGTIT